MLIPAIDLMGGRIVQLVRGEELRVSSDDFAYWIDRFRAYPLVQLIDLDAAKREGNNRSLIERIARELPVQVGGGIRSAADAQALLALGARRVIFGSALFPSAGIDITAPPIPAAASGRSASSPAVIRATATSLYAAGVNRRGSPPTMRYAPWSLSVEAFSTPTSIRRALCRVFRCLLLNACVHSPDVSSSWRAASASRRRLTHSTGWAWMRSPVWPSTPGLSLRSSALGSRASRSRYRFTILLRTTAPVAANSTAIPYITSAGRVRCTSRAALACNAQITASAAQIIQIRIHLEPSTHRKRNLRHGYPSLARRETP